MKHSIPRPQLILGYKELVDDNIPENRLELLNGICKKNLIAEIAGLNYRIKPNRSLKQDTTLHTQREELLYFCGGDNQLRNKYALKLERYTPNEKVYPLLFTRATCLFALEEIMQSDLPEIPDFSMKDSWEALLQYLLAVNTNITAIERTDAEEETDGTEVPAEEGKTSLLEILNPKMLPLNELKISADPVYVPFRAYHLFEYLAQHEEIGQHFLDYINEQYNIPWDNFVYEVMRMYIANNVNGENNLINPITGQPIDTTFVYNVKEEDAYLFKKLSERVENNNPEILLSIKKGPFYNSDDKTFVLTDSILLIDKLYNQFINDFWFDKVKGVKAENGNPLFPIKRYRSIIGYFFETYISQIFDHFYSNSKHVTLRKFDELKVNTPGGQIELADVFVRENKNVFLAQVKSTSIYDKEKYSGDLDEFYKNDRDAFFNSFGMGQLISSISNLETLAAQIDTRFPIGKCYRIYPAIIVNDKALQTPLMAHIFNQRFKELIAPLRSNKVYIYPLSIIHVGDLEYLEDSIHSNPKRFFEVLHSHVQYDKFMPPFYHSLYLNNIYPNHNKTMRLFKVLINKFGPQEAETN